MTNTDFKLLKAALEAKLKTIVSGSDKRQDIIIQQSPDDLDQTQFAAERDLTVSLLNRESEMSRRVKSALRRMGDRTYGTCLACDETISIKRLKAVPWTEFCLACQEMSDLKKGAIFGAVDEQVELGAN